MAISDIVVIGIVFMTVYVCTKKGLALTLYSIFSSLVAVIGALLLRPFISAALTALNVDKFFYRGIYENVNAAKTNLFGESTVGTGSKLAEALNLPDFTQSILENNVTSWDSLGSLDKIVKEISTVLAGFIVDVISVVFLIVVIMVILHLIKGVVDIFSKIPIIKQINKIGGFLVGIILAFLWISVAGMAVHLFSTTEYFSVILADLNKSMLAHYFYNTNVIALLLSGF